MHSLDKFDFKPEYTKGIDDIAEEFYIPCMKNSISYNRITGYFSSTIFVIAWHALKEFVENGGKVKIICSPNLTSQDVTAILDGYELKNSETSILNQMEKEIEYLFESQSLLKPAKVLATLIALEVIEIKIAFINGEIDADYERLFHDKVGIFGDRNQNLVGFRGSMNETFNGLSSSGNLESIDCFPSWCGDRDLTRVNRASYYFDELWNNRISNVDVKVMPENLKEKIIKNSELKKWAEIVDEITEIIDFGEKIIGNNYKEPRDHQIIALKEWNVRDRRGIFEHATGSGKTYTALLAIRDALLKGETPVILVPSKLLLHQWKKEINETIGDMNPSILLCGDGNIQWKKDSLLFAWTRKTEKNYIVLSTLQTAQSEKFRQLICEGTHIFIVIDEVHRVGSLENQKILDIKSGPRLGLSATPRRAGDLEGTQKIFDYFNGVIPPVFTIQDAIKSGSLTPYYYFPHSVHLNESEQTMWDELTKKINHLYAKLFKKEKDHSQSFNNVQLKKYLIQRARIIKNAEAKIDKALEIIKKSYEKGQKWLIYCDNQVQLKKMLDLLIVNNFDALEYHTGMMGDKEATLNYFNSNEGILVAIKCLDEGIDIPSITHALIIASSKNPREFIQRRGRILRKYPNKNFAFLNDIIVLPFKSIDSDVGVSFTYSELSRAIQFGKWAENPTSIASLELIAIEIGLNWEELVDGGIEDEEES